MIQAGLVAKSEGRRVANNKRTHYSDRPRRLYTGIVITCLSNQSEAPNAGILQLDEGHYVNGKWKPGRRLNGDQDHQGRHIRIPVGEYGIQKLTLYRY